MIGVVAHNVSFFGHAADNVRRGFDHMPHHKERRRGAVLFQRIQNGLRVAVFVAAVKGEIDNFLADVPYIPRVVLGQKVRGGVADGSQALLREGQPPVVGGSGNSRVTGGQGGRGAAAQQPRQRQAGQEQQAEYLQAFTHRIPPHCFAVVCPAGKTFIPGCENGRKLV